MSILCATGCADKVDVGSRKGRGDVERDWSLSVEVPALSEQNNVVVVHVLSVDIIKEFAASVRSVDKIKVILMLETCCRTIPQCHIHDDDDKAPIGVPFGDPVLLLHESEF